MKRLIKMKKSYLQQALILAGLIVATGPLMAEDYYLAAKPFIKTMPDGELIPMWGYVEDSGGLCYIAADDAARLACIDALPAPQVPGPRLVATDTDLTVYLSNGLPEPSSIVITGQENPVSSASGPTWNDGSTGGRAGNMAKKVRSFGSEAAAAGGRESYSWSTAGLNELGVGTYILYSGTHPQKQVYMGLYSPVTRDAVPALPPSLDAQVYPGVNYEEEVMLFYSEIDPALNQSIDCISAPIGDCAGVEPYTTSIHFHPRWFLVNGEPFEEGVTADIFVGSEGETSTLVRFLSTAGMTHVPVLQGLYMTIHAEDGRPYTWQDGLGAQTLSPRLQYSAQLPPMKTRDAILTALPANGSRFAVYDGNGYMTNPTDPADVSVGDDVGGMLRFLAVLADLDDDGIPDTQDNCIEVKNPSQCNGDGDIYGNHCDPDFDNNLIVNGLDVGPFKAAFGTADAVADLNCDGIVNGLDVGTLKAFFGSAPGPSGLTPPP